MVDEREMRQVLADKLTEAAKTDDRIVILDADLMSCHKTQCFQKAFPERFINVGIAEANMIGMAAGMSAFGKIPFAYSFAPFATRRCFDQIFISVAYAKQNVKIVGSDPGVTAQANGGTHMPFEDMGIMRTIPKMVCFEPTDAQMLEKAVPQIINYPGAVYIRLFRKQADTVFDSNIDFELGKANKIRDGKDVTLICSGIMVSKAIEAADKLAAEGIDAAVLNIHTWKPIDEDAIVEAAEKTGAIVTCENHSVYGGLSSAVAEVLAAKKPTVMERVGVENRFGEVGKLPYLCETFGLTADNIVAKAKAAIARK